MTTNGNPAVLVWQERYSVLSAHVHAVAETLGDKTLTPERRQPLAAAFAEAWHQLAEHSRQHPAFPSKSEYLR